MSYITMRDLPTGADFGAQMMACAGLYSVGKTTGHNPVIISNNEKDGYRLKLVPEMFKNFYNTFSKVDYLEHKWEWKKFRSGLLLDNEIYDLDKGINYNFPIGFNTYHYWIEKEKEIRELYEFSDEIKTLCSRFVSSVRRWDHKEVVAVHFRRGDYLKLSSLNLKLDYYYEAIKYFDPLKHSILLFSNTDEDVEWAENNFKPKGFTVYRTDHKYPLLIDMCVMSLCDHNIIANSSYSWWGAFLNNNPNKKIVCPHDYLNVPSLNYVNGNYYPKEWVAIM